MKKDRINIDFDGIEISITPNKMVDLLQKLSPTEFVEAFHGAVKTSEKLEYLAIREILYHSSEESDFNKYAKQALCGELPDTSLSEVNLAYAKYHKGIKEGWEMILSSIHQFHGYEYFENSANKG